MHLITASHFDIQITVNGLFPFHVRWCSPGFTGSRTRPAHQLATINQKSKPAIFLKLDAAVYVIKIISLAQAVKKCIGAIPLANAATGLCR